MKKRYALFIFDPTNPKGGWEDLHESFDDLEEALHRFRMMIHGYGQIVDLKTKKIIKQKLKLHPAIPIN